jgi:hypothetical protein
LNSRRSDFNPAAFVIACMRVLQANARLVSMMPERDETADRKRFRLAFSKMRKLLAFARRAALTQSAEARVAACR